MIFSTRKSTYLLAVLLISLSMFACAQQSKKPQVITAAERTEMYIELLKGKRVGIVANQTSVIPVTKKVEVYELYEGTEKISDTFQINQTHYTHLVDSLRSLGITIDKVFAPEHGFRGKADAGELVKDGLDQKTGIPIISLYGKNKKPTNEQLQGLDVVVFDIQDVGARFYTYISTLHYVMEACAQNNIPVILLDRPNPNGHYVDGPVLEMKHKSFVGMHPVPIVYGMTIGEYGKMINGEKWLEKGIQADLTVIPLKNYNHQTPYSLPIKPSPNLPNDKSVNLYPSLCLFEGTSVSVGRGTNLQFQVYGSPHLKRTDFYFIPEPNEGAKYPKHQRSRCYGENLQSHERLNGLTLTWLQKANKQTNTQGTFFNSFFVKLAGTTKLEDQIGKGLSEEEIKASWQKDLNKFKLIRKKYLLYD